MKDIDRTYSSRLVTEAAKQCEWDFEQVTALYLDLLTDINFHSEKKELEQMIWAYWDKVTNEV